MWFLYQVWSYNCILLSLHWQVHNVHAHMHFQILFLYILSLFQRSEMHHTYKSLVIGRYYDMGSIPFQLWFDQTNIFQPPTTYLGYLCWFQKCWDLKCWDLTRLLFNTSAVAIHFQVLCKSSLVKFIVCMLQLSYVWLMTYAFLCLWDNAHGKRQVGGLCWRMSRWQDYSNMPILSFRVCAVW